jgi:hypothetical protein
MKKLIGSEKQINWAEKIRAEYAEQLVIVKQKSQDSQASCDERKICARLAETLENAINEQEHAGFWIDRRNHF